MKKTLATKQAMRARVVERVYERNTTLLNSDAAGHVTMTVPVSAAGSLLAARLTGYQALRDQVRIDHVKVTLNPINGTDSEGQTAVYVERDPAAAVVATVALAADQFEARTASSWQKLCIDWYPQQPTDLTFNLLNPGTTVLSNIYVYGASLPVSVASYNVTVESWLSLRGRP
jgi:hypothetical protein